MARYKKKRARELQHDRFRDTAIGLFDRLGNVLEGRGRTILYGLGGLVVVGAAVWAGVAWSNKKSNEARRAIGRGIAIASAPLASAASPMASTAGSFANEKERATKAIEEFEKVAAKYGDPYRTEARYFIATNRLIIDRPKAIEELTELSNSNQTDVATLAKFALAQAKEADGKFDEAAPLYSQIAGLNSVIVSPDTAKVRLAAVYQKQGKKKEAAEILFQIVDAARKAKDKEGNPVPQSGAAQKASQELQKLDPDRYAQLPPEPPRTGFGV